jgi:aryl-alcohol dehydrogenase-like predicted oxidoreductase
MKKTVLGRTGIKVSKLGIGTGTSHPSGGCSQAFMEKGRLAELLVYAFERGINFWDTAVQYDTHQHIAEALKHVKRADIVITTKLTTSGKNDTIREFDRSLRELNTDYVDVCLVHGVRTERELKSRIGAIETMLEFKREGKVRAVGLSSHGLSALAAVIEIQEIDVVWARINYAGLCMDSHKLGLYDQFASINWFKKAVKLVVPKKIISLVRPQPEADSISEDECKKVIETLKVIHSQSKGIVGMKVMAEGELGCHAQKAVKYVDSLSYVDSFIIGMLNKEEIDENCRSVKE